MSEDFGGSRVGIGFLGAQKTDLEQSDVPSTALAHLDRLPSTQFFHHVTKWHPSPGGLRGDAGAPWGIMGKPMGMCRVQQVFKDKLQMLIFDKP